MTETPQEWEDVIDYSNEIMRAHGFDV